MAYAQYHLNNLVTLMNQPDSGFTEKIALISSLNVNECVRKVPLIIYYLRKCNNPNLDLLTAFATNGCDFNVQGDDGETPLHLLVKKKNLNSTDLSSVVELLVTCGADLSVVDKHGNNVLMVAVLVGHDQVVFDMLTKDKALAKQLATQTNKAGEDVIALFFKSARNQGISVNARLKQLVELGANITSTDKNGNTCLHHLVQCPVNMVKMYTTKSQRQKDPASAFKWRQTQFKRHLNTLIGAGANNSQPNKSGLIPLQVAFSSQKTMFKSILDLEPLVPDEHVLEQLVPRPDVDTLAKEPLNISEQVWFVAQLTKFSSAEDALKLVQASIYCTPKLIQQVILKRRIKPTVEDLKVPCRNQKWDVIEVYIKHMLPRDICNLKLNTTDYIGRLISFDDNPDNQLIKQRVVKRLISNGYDMAVSNRKVAFNATVKQRKVRYHDIEPIADDNLMDPYVKADSFEFEHYAEQMRFKSRIEPKKMRRNVKMLK